MVGVEAPGSDPAEVEVLRELGYRALLGVGTHDGERGYLLEIYSDGDYAHAGGARRPCPRAGPPLHAGPARADAATAPRPVRRRVAPVEYGKLIGAAFRLALAQPPPVAVRRLRGQRWRRLQLQLLDRRRRAARAAAATPSTSTPPLIVAILVIVALALILFWVVVTMLSQGALTESVAAADRGERRGFRQALRAGRSSFWRVFGLALLVWRCSCWARCWSSG